jgi:3-oxoacyl-[acyl-carrier-protein] synthase II
MSTANLYALIAADEAIKDSQWTVNNDEESYKSGVSIAIGMSGIPEISEAAIALNSKNSNGYKLISPYFVPKILSNLSNGIVSIKYKLKGPNHCVTTACAAGAHSISDAYNFIKNGLVDVMVCGGTEACIYLISITVIFISTTL